MSKSTSFSLIQYLREAKEELQKVTWPTREETIRYSLLVIGICAILALYFTGLDFLLNLGLEALLTIAQ